MNEAGLPGPRFPTQRAQASAAAAVAFSLLLYPSLYRVVGSVRFTLFVYVQQFDNSEASDNFGANVDLSAQIHHIAA